MMLTIADRHSAGLTLPAAKGEAGESAQCTAHRATWETTGFNVEVGTFLGTIDKDTRVYACHLQANFGSDFTEFPVPAWSQSNVTAIRLVDPYQIQLRDWQRQEELLLIRAYFDKIN